MADTYQNIHYSCSKFTVEIEICVINDRIIDLITDIAFFDPLKLTFLTE